MGKLSNFQEPFFELSKTGVSPKCIICQDRHDDDTSPRFCAPKRSGVVRSFAPSFAPSFVLFVRLSVSLLVCSFVRSFVCVVRSFTC